MCSTYVQYIQMYVHNNVDITIHMHYIMVTLVLDNQMLVLLVQNSVGRGNLANGMLFVYILPSQIHLIFEH